MKYKWIQTVQLNEILIIESNEYLFKLMLRKSERFFFLNIHHMDT